jgi:antitoxin component of RelBE/YafQ-DinJ toxin-antitoxin module
MPTTPLNVKIDVSLKKEAQQVAKSLGIPLSTIVVA